MMSKYFIFSVHKKVNIDLLSYKIGYLAGKGMGKEVIEEYINLPKVPIGGCPTMIDKELDRYVREIMGLEGDDDE